MSYKNVHHVVPTDVPRYAFEKALWPDNHYPEDGEKIFCLRICCVEPQRDHPVLVKSEHRSMGHTEEIHLIQKRLLWSLAIGLWEAIVWRSLKQSISLFSYAQTIASQCAIANAQSNLF